MPPRTPTSRCVSGRRSKPRLAAERVSRLRDARTRRCRPCLRAWNERGISVDPSVLSRLSSEFGRKQARSSTKSRRSPASRSIPASPKQLGDILFGQMGLPGGTKTKTGQWSTGARALEELAEQGHKLPQVILDWRQVSKLRSTYTEALPELRQSEDASRPHKLRARGDLDRTAVIVRAELAEHSDPHRRRPQDSPRFRRLAGHEARLGRLFADRAAAAVGSRERADTYARRSRTASTSTP